MAPTAAELFKQATDKRARFADGKQGVSKQKETREFGQPYLRSWWPHFMLKLQRMRTSKFWVCGCVFSFSSKTFLTNNSIWPMVARMLAAKKGIGRKYMCVVCPVHYFPLQLLTYIAVRINKIQGWPHWKLSEKMADQSVKTSNRQMTGFFPSWQVFPRKLRHWDSQGFKYENYQNANSHTFRSCILNYLMVMPVQPQEIVGLSLLFLLISPILSSLSVNLNYYLTHYHDWFLLACVNMC